MGIASGLLRHLPQGLEGLLAAELAGFGATEVKETVAGVAFSGSLETAYRACLWSRLASRVLMTVSVVPAADAAALYAGVHDLPWEQHLGADGTLAVDFTGTSEQITHTLFGAQKVKDAVVDRFRERGGRRPSVDLRNPDLRINVHLAGAEARVSLDLSGESLHKRGYRDETRRGAAEGEPGGRGADPRRLAGDRGGGRPAARPDVRLGDASRSRRR